MRLYVITNNFPYVADGGEVMFVEPELKVLATEQLHLTVAPVRQYGEMLSVPEGVSVDLSLGQRLAQSSLTLLVSFIFGCFTSRHDRYLFTEIVRSFSLGRRAFVRALSWACGASQTRRWLESKLSDDGVGIYTYWNTAHTVGCAQLLDRDRLLAVVTRVHGYDLYVERHSPQYIPFREFLLSSITRVFSISQAGVAYLLNNYRVRERVVLARLGTDDPGFRCQPSDDGAIRIVSCSFVVPVKRLELVVSVVAELRRREPEKTFIWTHIGGGGYFDDFKKFAVARLGSEGFQLTGHLDNSQVLEFYKNNPVDLFINLSESEGIPVSMMEASSVGVPIVATDVGGVSEIVTSKNGCLVSRDPTIEEVVEAVASVLSVCGANGFSLRRAARLLWEERFNASRNYKVFSTEIVDALRGGRKD